MKRVQHEKLSEKFIEKEENLASHDKRLWQLRKNRDQVTYGIPEWEEMRRLASAIKEHTLTHLADYLDERGSPMKFRNTARPSRPNTIDGTAARLLMLISMISVKRFLGANSSR